MALLLAVYGTLRVGLALPYQPPDFDALLTDREPCILQGRLVDLGTYPGLVDVDDPDAPGVVGDLCRLAEADLARFDAYESYDPAHPEASKYLRRKVALRSPALEAWTYVFNQPWDPSMVVAGGDWAAR